MKQHAKKLVALVMAFAMCLGVMGTATASTGKVAATLNYKDINVTLNGKDVQLKDVNGGSTEPFIMNNSTYVPLRAVSEALGLTVVWDAANTEVKLTNGHPFTQTKKVDKSTQPRIIITTDLEVDDMNGIMLSLMYASDYDLAGIVWTAGQFHFTGDGEHTLAEITPNYKCEAGTAGGKVENAGQLKEYRPVDPTFLTRMIDVYYRADYEYLSKNNPNYPTPDYLLSIAKVGNIQFEGDYREETEGSKLIYNCIMDDDMRPLYIQHWGGSNTTVRALVSIYEDYHNADGTPKAGWDDVLKKVVAKVRTGGGEDNCWADSKVADMFPGIQGNDRRGFSSFGNYFQAALIGEAPVVDFGGFKMPLGTNETVNPYYQGEWLTDAFKFGHGQVMAQFHLMNDGQVIYGEEWPYQYGLQTYIDWGELDRLGYGTGGTAGWPRTDYDTYDWMCCQFGCSSFVDFGLRQDVNNSDDRYVVARFEDLAARADWAIMDPSNCNHAPVVSVDKLDVTAKAGETVTLKGTATDPDGDRLTASWWVPSNAWTYAAVTPAEGEEPVQAPELKVSDEHSLTTQFIVPTDAVKGDRFVVNLEVKDNAERPMTRYAQVVITVA